MKKINKIFAISSASIVLMHSMMVLPVISEAETQSNNEEQVTTSEFSELSQMNKTTSKSAALKLINSIEKRANEFRDLWINYPAQTWINAAGHQQDLGTNNTYPLNQGGHQTGLISLLPGLTETDRNNFRSSQQQVSTITLFPFKGTINTDHNNFLRYVEKARSNVNNSNSITIDFNEVRQTIETIKSVITRQRNAEVGLGTFITTHFLTNEIRILNSLLDDIKDIENSVEADKPVINASNKEIYVNGQFDPLEGVTAVDKNGADITSSIKVTSNNVNASKPGNYTVTYEVTDSEGNTANKTVTVTVKERSEADKPVITAADKEIYVNSKFDPLEGVTAVDKNGADITSSIKVTSNNVNASKPGNYTVTYEVTDSEGNTANKTVTVTVKERSEADKPVITAADKEIYVNSKFDPLEGVTAVDKNGADITSSIKVTSNNVNASKPGNYTVTYEVTDSEGNTASKTITVTIKDKEVPSYEGTIKANDFTIKQDGYIKGTYTGDVSKISVIVNGKEQAKITVTGSPYQYYVGGKISSVNDSVTVVAYGPDGKELDRANVTLKEKESPNYQGTITANDFTVKQDSYIKGTYTGDVSKISVIINGKEQMKISATGSPYQYYVGGKITSLNDNVTVVAYGPDGKELDRANVTLKEKESPSYKGTITANEFTIRQDGYIKGAYTGDVSKISVIVNGKEQAKISATASPYQYYINGKISSVNDSVTVVAYGPDGKELDRADVTLKNIEKPTQGTVTANEFKVGGKDAYIHGKTTGDVSLVRMFVNGKQVSQKAVNEDGTYSYYARPAINDKNDKVEMVGYDGKGKELDRIVVTLV